MRVLGQKKTTGGRRTPPPSSLFRVNDDENIENLTKDALVSYWLKIYFRLG